MLKSQPGQAPNCFGDLFNKDAKECVGGFDLKWTGDAGNHYRPRCDFVDDCANATHTKQAAPQVIPVGNLIRPQPHTAFGAPSGYGRPPPPPAPTGPTPMQSRAWGVPTQQQQATPYQGQHPTHFAGHYGVPQYLTVRQPVNSGPIMERLFWETIRSMGKSLGHTLANFFDSEIFGRHGGPGPYG